MLKAEEDFGGFVDLAALQAVALLLYIAELLDSLVELAGEARAMEVQRAGR